jgi:sigma-70-like protein
VFGRGDGDAGEVVLDEQQVLVYRYLRRRTKNADDAEELTQQVFADAALTLSRMEAGPGSLLGLLYTIARRRFADEARRNGYRDERVPLEGIDQLALTGRENRVVCSGGAHRKTSVIRGCGGSSKGRTATGLSGHFGPRFVLSARGGLDRA